MNTFLMSCAGTAIAICLSMSNAIADPLPSWSDAETKSRIIAFVEDVTDPKSSNFVPQKERIATFDNDGTLWGEQPVYFQLIFAVDEIGNMALKDPSILTSDALKAAAKKDYEAIISGGKEAVLEILKVSHSGMSVDDFQARVKAWLDTAKHPSTGLGYDQMTYQPMVELLRYLRDEDFKTYIVSGGGIHFMRVFSEAAYGIPPEQVIGTYTETEYQIIDGTPKIVKSPAIGFVDDKEGKPVNIERIIGRRPIIAGGNSDGDFAMIEWSTAGEGPRLGLLVHHTDAEREVAYDRDSHIGKLVDGLDRGPDLGWLIIDMANDWERVFTGKQP